MIPLALNSSGSVYLNHVFPSFEYSFEYESAAKSADMVIFVLVISRFETIISGASGGIKSQLPTESVRLPLLKFSIYDFSPALSILPSAVNVPYFLPLHMTDIVRLNFETPSASLYIPFS